MMSPPPRSLQTLSFPVIARDILYQVRKGLTTTYGDLAGANAKVNGLESQFKTLQESVDEALKARDEAIEAKLVSEGEYQVLKGSF